MFETRSYYAIVDTGSSLTHVPGPYYEWLIKELSKGINYINLDNKEKMGPTFNCADYREIPTPYLRLGDVWLPFSAAHSSGLSIIDRPL